MRLSNRMLSNAATTYLRFGTSLVLGVFFIWYVVGRIGMVGFGMIALSAAMHSFSGAVDTAIRFGLVREMAAAIATGEARRVRISLSSAFMFCAPAAVLLSVVGALIAGLAYAGLFNTPSDPPGLRQALTVLLLAEGVFGGVRVFFAPYTQALYAAQRIGLDNALFVLRRVTYVLSAVLVLGVILPEAPLDVQLYGFAASRLTIQLADVVVGIWLAKRSVSGLTFARSAVDRAEFRAITGTVWHSGQVTLLMDLNVYFIAVLINLFFGITYNGLWQVVIQLGGYARRFAQGLLRGIEPLSTRLDREGRQAMVVDLMERTIRYQLGAVLPVVTAVGIFMEPILNLWIGGRMAGDPNLAVAGISAADAIRFIAIMTYVYLAASVIRTSMFGVQRILYGVGEVRSYSWFAKYAALINVGLAALLMWLFDTPVAAPAALLVTYLIYYPGIILRAAASRTDLSIRRSLARSIPRPLVATAVVCPPLLAARYWVSELTLWSLAALACGTGILYGLVLVTVVLQPDERARLRQLFKSGAGRLRGRRQIAETETLDETSPSTDPMSGMRDD